MKIQDNGSGIRGEEKELIFLYGYGKNTGLGLAISLEILSITGITIRETGSFGTGTCFELHIPGGGCQWRYKNPVLEQN
jgi:signal transduction histidine kinase